ncbi:sugar-binding protein [uncultured Victivallis sp.]|uniref:sugar-binding protein n=1 Tax=uncultured Victivallis sp. TaxID=354118 RepID=UPI0025DC7BDE|nr:sugar-binding protein [uncultured Victivallis sp.]
MKFTGLLMVCGMAGCLPLISAELLPNGTFEQRFREWHYPDYAGKPEPGEIVSDVVYGGKFAYRMGLSGDKDNFLYVSFKPVTGRDHQITLMWKADGLPPDDAEIQILRNGGGKVIGWASNPAGSGVNRLAVTGGTHDWRQVRFTISGKEFPPEVTGAHFYVKRRNNGVGNLYIDEISIQPVDDKAPAAAKLDRWEYEKWRNIPEPGGIDRAVTHAGGGSYCMFGPGQQGGSIYQRIPFRPGAGLNISFYLKAEQIPDKDATFMILVNHKDKKTSWIAMPPGSGVNVLGSAGGSFDWREFRISLPAEAIPEDASSLLFFLKRKQNSSGKLYIDSFTATPAVEKKDVPAANLWPGDGSFEGGSSFFQLPPDETRSFHGRRSIRMAQELTGLTTGYLFRVLRPNRTYTVSGYATADRPGKLVVKADSHRYQEIGSGSVSLKPGEWKRFSFRLQPQHLVTSFRLGFNKPAGTTIWLDAFQLAEGDAAGLYTAEAPLTLGTDRTGAPGEILFTGPKPLVQTARLRNNTDAPVPVTFTATLEGYGISPRKLLAETLTLAPGETAVRPLTVLTERETGYYVLRLRAESAGRSYGADFPVVVTEPPPPQSEQPYFGLHPMGPTSPEILRRIGVGATRHMPGWRYIPEKEGKYRFSDHDIRYARAGMKQLNSVKVGLVPNKYRKPDNGFADPADMNEFLRQMLAAWGGAIRDWEIENEPDLVFPGIFKKGLEDAAENYAACVNAAAPVIKGADPGFRLLGSGVSGVDFNSGFPFTRRVLEKAGNVIDIVPVHPYANARYVGADRSDIGPEANAVYRKTLELRELIRETGGRQPIWYGEIGWALDVEEDFLSESALRHAEYLSRLMLIGKAAGVERVLYFLADFCIEKERYYYGLWRNTLPLPAALAYAASAQWLEGAKPGEIISDSDIQCFTYLDRENRPFAALWTADGTPTRARIPLDAARVEAADFFNRPVKLNTGSLELALSGAPVYLRLRSGNAAELAEAVRQAKYDLPPVSAGWRIRNGSTVEVTLVNRRTAPLSGKLTISGAAFGNPERTISLQPGEEVKEIFSAADSLDSRELTLRVESTLGELESRYRAEFLPCPATGRPDFRSAKLPAAGRLPTMASRDFLIPNDPENGYEGAEDLSIESAIGHDAENLYLAINVRDDVHVQPFTAGRLWAADSIQLAIDTQADALPNAYGFAPDDYEMSFGLTANGSEKEFDNIYERGRAAASLEQIECNVFRSGDLTCYRMAIPWRVLNMKPAAGTVFGLNFIANDHDGHGRNYWMGLTPGIGEAKNPYVYRKFILRQ